MLFIKQSLILIYKQYMLRGYPSGYFGMLFKGSEIPWHDFLLMERLGCWQETHMHRAERGSDVQGDKCKLDTL